MESGEYRVHKYDKKNLRKVENGSVLLGTEYLNIEFPGSTLLCAGYSVKQKYVKYNFNRDRNFPHCKLSK